jgi:menaquinone-specific isochorismate synthase
VVTSQPQPHPALPEDVQPGIEYDHRLQGRLISCSCPAEGVDVYTFLRHAQGQPRFYWRDGRTGITLAGLGVALSLMGWSEVRYRQLQRQAQELFERAMLLDDAPPLAAPRLFGGFSFRQDFVPDFTWAAFHPAHFILPHYQLVHYEGQSWLTINALLPPGEDPSALHASLQEALHTRYTFLRAEEGSRGPGDGSPTPGANGAYQIRYPLSQEEWSAMIEAAIAAFASTPLRKVVLARISELRRPDMIDVDAALHYLDTHYPECYTFLVEPRPNHAFFGATPELLVAVNGEELETMGLAGSTKRGSTPAEDEQLAGDLLNSAKDRHEQALVVDLLRERLAPITSRLDIPAAPVVMQLSNIQHLYTPVHGQLKEANGVLPLVEILHPTPALGGLPRDLALDFIQNHEGIPRGWYAAPVGWIDHNLDGVFAVAIRSAVVQRNRAWLYAGAGIVSDSRPAREWEETGWKFRPMLGALSVDWKKV